MRIVALLATYNERRFIEPCLEHLERHGIDAYLIDNGSTDNTVELAEPWLGRNLIGIEQAPRGKDDVYDWRSILRRKEELAQELDADWFIHQDPDEVRLPPSKTASLAHALEAADNGGFNAVNFVELSFIPTREWPDHDNREFQRTLRTYYPFCPTFPHRLNAWKAAAACRPDLAAAGGHRVAFAGIRIYPSSFPMKHYLFLSIPHAVEKYTQRRYCSNEVKSGWHGWRATLTKADLRLPSESELRFTRSDEDLDLSEPRKTHFLEATGLREGGRRCGS